MCYLLTTSKLRGKSANLWVRERVVAIRALDCEGHHSIFKVVVLTCRINDCDSDSGNISPTVQKSTEEEEETHDDD